MSVYEDGAPHPDPAIWSGRACPFSGICYGAAAAWPIDLGGDVSPPRKREYGPATVTITTEDGLFAGSTGRSRVWMSHGDSITAPPDGLPGDCPDGLHRAVRRPGRSGAAAVRHPVPPRGRAHAAGPRRPAQLRGRACRRCRPTWTPAQLHRLDRRETHPCAPASADGKVICALSGGVDSAVAATLVHRAVGDQLTCIYVDHGLMRQARIGAPARRRSSRTWA